jgi:hypothetical protein
MPHCQQQMKCIVTCGLEVQLVTMAVLAEVRRSRVHIFGEILVRDVNPETRWLSAIFKSSRVADLWHWLMSNSSKIKNTALRSLLGGGGVYVFLPVAVDTFGDDGRDALDFIIELVRRVISATQTRMWHSGCWHWVLRNNVAMLYTCIPGRPIYCCW